MTNSLGDNLIARTRIATGDGNASALLQRIAHWMPQATKVFGGELWTTKTALDWCADTGLTPKEYKTAIARLRRLGLVVTEQHLCGSKNVTHVRLTEAGRQVVGLPTAPEQAGGQS